MLELKNETEITEMRKAGRIAAEALTLLEKEIKPGVTTGYLDRIAEKYILSQGAKPAFKGYGDYPATLCTSINEQVVHGIPGLRVLKSGDIISIDCGAIYNGFYSDTARTYAVGDISEEKQNLLRVCEESLLSGIAQIANGKRLSDISAAIQAVVEKNGMSVVRDYTGHGIGRKLHESPEVRNFGRPGRGPRLEKGMVLAIEPMINLGDYPVELLENGTVVTQDRKDSAHFEHTVAITENGYEILTSL